MPGRARTVAPQGPEFRHAIVRKVSAAIAHGLTSQALGVPDLALARWQHAAYVGALTSLGVEVEELEAQDDLPDSHFVEDVAVIVRGTAILTRPAAPERREEVARLRPALESRVKVRELGGTERDLVDGGDLLVSGRHAWIGVGRRTNLGGAERLRRCLKEVEPRLRVELIPFSDRLHLKTGLTALAPGRFVGDPGLRLERPWTGGPIAWLPPPEGAAANVLPVNGSVLVDASSPTVRARATEAVGSVIPLDLSEFRKMDGGLTCLSLLY